MRPSYRECHAMWLDEGADVADAQRDADASDDASTALRAATDALRSQLIRVYGSRATASDGFPTFHADTIASPPSSRESET